MGLDDFFTLEHYPYKLLLFSGIFLFVLKFFFSNNYLAIVMNSVIEFTILLIIYCLLLIADRQIIYKKESTRPAIYLGFYLIFLFNFFPICSELFFL